MTGTAAIDVAAILEVLSDDELDRLVSDLQAAQAARVATSHATRSEHEPGGGG